MDSIREIKRISELLHVTLQRVTVDKDAVGFTCDGERFEGKPDAARIKLVEIAASKAEQNMKSIRRHCGTILGAQAVTHLADYCCVLLWLATTSQPHKINIEDEDDMFMVEDDHSIAHTCHKFVLNDNEIELPTTTTRLELLDGLHKDILGEEIQIVNIEEVTESEFLGQSDTESEPPPPRRNRKKRNSPTPSISSLVPLVESESEDVPQRKPPKSEPRGKTVTETVKRKRGRPPKKPRGPPPQPAPEPAAEDPPKTPQQRGAILRAYADILTTSPLPPDENDAMLLHIVKVLLRSKSIHVVIDGETIPLDRVVNILKIL